MKTWVEDIKEEYNLSKKVLEEYREKLDLDNPKDKEDDIIVGEMVSDMKYALEWLNRGRRPGNRRGADKRSVYQRRALLDMDLFPSIDLRPNQVYLNNEQKSTLIETLITFSDRERQCYLLHMAQGWSLQEIAEELNLKKRTVQQYVDRAKEKVRKKVS
ncbi:MAG: sigma-70 family RNA polymerase sigma factor [Bacillota bacterium]